MTLTRPRRARTFHRKSVKTFTLASFAGHVDGTALDVSAPMSPLAAAVPATGVVVANWQISVEAHFAQVLAPGAAAYVPNLQGWQ